MNYCANCILHTCHLYNTYTKKSQILYTFDNGVYSHQTLLAADMAVCPGGGGVSSLSEYSWLVNTPLTNKPWTEMEH